MLREVGVADPVLDVSADVDSSQNERGLLSVAFAGGKTYLYFTAKAASAVSGTAGEIQVREFPGDRILISIPHTDNAQPQRRPAADRAGRAAVHRARATAAAPTTSTTTRQDPGSLLGKLIRIDPATGAHEVLSRGLRNPWRFSFAPDGQIVIADVGQSQREEIDVGLAANYGWPCKEGELNYRSDPGCDGIATAAPVFTRSHDDGACSITGGYVVTDPGLPSLLGRYVYGDYCAPALYSLDLANPSGNAAVGLDVPSLVSFGRDACGRIYTVSLAGPVSRLQEGAATACPPPVADADADTDRPPRPRLPVAACRPYPRRNRPARRRPPPVHAHGPDHRLRASRAGASCRSHCAPTSLPRDDQRPRLQGRHGGTGARPPDRAGSEPPTPTAAGSPSASRRSTRRATSRTSRPA